MREIKFRIWDKVNKEMINVVEMDFFRRRMYFMTENKYYSERSLDDVILMQYTGLKDKKGREVYDGDIVKVLHGEIKLVKYIECYGGFKAIHDTYGEDVITNLKDLEFKVVGNVYENPLLI